MSKTTEIKDFDEDIFIDYNCDKLQSEFPSVLTNKKVDDYNFWTECKKDTYISMIVKAKELD